MKPKNLSLHPSTLQAAQAFLENPSHALLLHGPLGSGKQALALWIASQLLENPEEALSDYPYLLLADTSTPSISIETIREQQHFLRLKTIGSRPIRRIIILPDAERMTPEAQNAFLKTLEEPPADTVLLLTSAHQHELLPTIRSRLQVLAVRPVAESTLKEYFTARHDPSAVERAYLLSGGLPGLMHALLSEETEHPLAVAIQQAKTLLQAPAFERLILADQLSKQKPETAAFLQALNQIARTGLQQAAKQQDQRKIQRWHRVLKAVYDAQIATDQNVNAKLVLTNLALAL